MTEKIDRIEKLVFLCFKELSEHTMQNEVISPQIKKINENLNSISEYISQIKDDDSMDIVSSSVRGYSQREFKSDDEKENLLKIAYALSRFDYVIINEILKSNYNQTAVFSYLSNKMKVKANTLKNYRDMFDPYVRQERSNRKGWYQRQLQPDFRIIKEEWDALDYKEIKSKISQIIGHSK